MFLYICLDKEHKEGIQLKTKIAVLGSCISRDLFNSHFVPNYKDFFDLVFDAQRTTMISLMQDSVVIDNNLLNILPHNPKNNARTKFITEDLNKIFLKKRFYEIKIQYSNSKNVYSLSFREC